MAPYCLTALVCLLVPVRLVTGSTIQVHGDITIANPQSPRCGETVPVAAPMSTTVTLDFESGAIAALLTAKEGFGCTRCLETYGTDRILYT